MLTDLIKKGFGEKEDYNCAEKILYGANQAYNLGLDQRTLKLAAGFGGGMGIGIVCGSLTAAVMVLGVLFVEKSAHENREIKNLTQEFLMSFRREMGQINCSQLKINYRTEREKCLQVLVKAAEILDGIVKRELPALAQSGAQ